MAAPQIPTARVATLLIGLGVLNLVVTAFIALVAARGWGTLSVIHAQIDLSGGDGARVARFEFATPSEMSALGDGDFVQHVELPQGTTAEVRVPRGDLARIASTSNTLKVLQLALPLAVSILFLVAGLKLRGAVRSR
ncbi:MAG: hypothetical protein IT454_04715 [Planctomycetes bacterium]|nr:hypothetical protein [Planctomycetota bacterium]